MSSLPARLQSKPCSLICFSNRLSSAKDCSVAFLSCRCIASEFQNEVNIASPLVKGKQFRLCVIYKQCHGNRLCAVGDFCLVNALRGGGGDDLHISEFGRCKASVFGGIVNDRRHDAAAFEFARKPHGETADSDRYGFFAFLQGFQQIAGGFGLVSQLVGQNIVARKQIAGGMFADDIMLVFEQSVREIVASNLCDLDTRIGDRTAFFNRPDSSDNGGFTVSRFVDYRRNPEADGKCRNNADNADDGSVTKGMRADGFLCSFLFMIGFLSANRKSTVMLHDALLADIQLF